MIKLRIDNIEVEVEDGSTILDASKKIGINIPTLCFMKDYAPLTTCMICVVKVEGIDNFVPACSMLVQNNMNVITNSYELMNARKTALELLLSEHAGDCFAPCERVCNLYINIPLMIRYIQEGELTKAFAIIQNNVGVDFSICRKCGYKCEKACRRKRIDEPLAINNLMSFLIGKFKTIKSNTLLKNITLKNVSIIRNLNESELETFLINCSKVKQIKPANIENGFNEEEAFKESNRCLKCDCRKKENCMLKDYSIMFDAKQIKYKGERLEFKRIINEKYIYESGKCIKCGRCVKISEKKNVKFGFSFFYKGFELEVGVPFNKYNDNDLITIINECIENCPTGALVRSLK